MTQHSPEKTVFAPLSFETTHSHQIDGATLSQFENEDLKWSDALESLEVQHAAGIPTGTETLGPRRGTLRFSSGVTLETPAFMPVGTAASVKSLSSEDIEEIGYNLILGNTYHLNLRPGMEVLESFGGLHNFMNWKGALLTDSGGFQVMSLAKLRKMNEQGVTFANHINGAKVFLSPEVAVQIQDTIGSDIQMVLDECTPHPATRDEVRLSMERSMRWAKRAREARSPKSKNQFGIVQGGMHPDLRALSARMISDLDFEGNAIGGLSVGESKRDMRRILMSTVPHLTSKKPRYLMGVGSPDDLFEASLLGVDLFDCVMPTRNARNGTVFVRTEEEASGKLHIKNAKHRFSEEPLDRNCRCLTCKNYSRAYLRHLFVGEELAVHRFLTIHSLSFLFDLMAEIRTALALPNPWEHLRDVRRRFVGSAQK